MPSGVASSPARFSSASRSRVPELVGPAGQPLREAVGQRRRDEPAVAPGGRHPEAAALEHHDVARRVVLLGLDRGPQPGEATTDDDQVGAVTRAR